MNTKIFSDGQVGFRDFDLRGHRTPIAGIVIGSGSDSLKLFTLSHHDHHAPPAPVEEGAIRYRPDFSLDKLRKDRQLRSYIALYECYCASEDEPFCNWLAINTAWRLFRENIDVRITSPHYLFMTILETKNELLLAIEETYAFSKR